MRLGIVTTAATPTSEALVRAAPTGLDVLTLTPEEAVERLGPGDACLGRLDVLESLDGIVPGLWCFGALEARGVTVLNPASALLASHDKLLTARLLQGADLPHPRTAHVSGTTPELRWRGPVVVKPRFGSWGRDVHRCISPASLRARLAVVEATGWFRRHGALVQELVPPAGHDLRVVVAGGEAVGAVRRVAAPGEWRTNVALGATRERVRAPRRARLLAVAAADVVGGDLVGVDLVPDGAGDWTILEVNGAVEFSADYGRRVFERALGALEARLGHRPAGAGVLVGRR